MLGESPNYIQYNDRRPQTVYLPLYKIYYVFFSVLIYYYTRPQHCSRFPHFDGKLYVF